MVKLKLTSDFGMWLYWLVWGLSGMVLVGYYIIYLNNYFMAMYYALIWISTAYLSILLNKYLTKRRFKKGIPW